MARVQRVDLQDMARLRPCNDNSHDLLARVAPLTTLDLVYFTALHIVAVLYLAAAIGSFFDQ